MLRRNETSSGYPIFNVLKKKMQACPTQLDMLLIHRSKTVLAFMIGMHLCQNGRGTRRWRANRNRDPRSPTRFFARWPGDDREVMLCLRTYWCYNTSDHTPDLLFFLKVSELVMEQVHARTQTHTHTHRTDLRVGSSLRRRLATEESLR